MKVEPEKQFPHAADIVADLARQYGITMTGYDEASSGIENTTLIVRGDMGKYVFRIYRQGKKTAANIQAELDFMAYLRENGISIPKILPNRQGEDITLSAASGATWQVIAMEFVAGVHVTRPSKKLLAEMAAVQARMHLLAAGYTRPLDNIRVITVLEEKEFIPQIDQSNLAPELQDFLRRGAEFRLELDDRLPTGPCHLDYNELNILCDGDSVTAALDFDDMSVVPYVVCLAYTLWDIHDGQGETALQAYLEIYEQRRPLTADERDVLFAAMLYRHYMITAIRILSEQMNDRDIHECLQTERYLLSTKTFSLFDK